MTGHPVELNPQIDALPGFIHTHGLRFGLPILPAAGGTHPSGAGLHFPTWRKDKKGNGNAPIDKSSSRTNEMTGPKILWIILNRGRSNRKTARNNHLKSESEEDAAGEPHMPNRQRMVVTGIQFNMVKSPGMKEGSRFIFF